MVGDVFVLVRTRYAVSVPEWLTAFTRPKYVRSGTRPRKMAEVFSVDELRTAPVNADSLEISTTKRVADGLPLADHCTVSEVTCTVHGVPLFVGTLASVAVATVALNDV